MMRSVINLIRTQALSDVAQYAYAASIPASEQLIFLAGACPLNLDGSTVGVGDVAVQASVGRNRSDCGGRLDHFLCTTDAAQRRLSPWALHAGPALPVE